MEYLAQYFEIVVYSDQLSMVHFTSLIMFSKYCFSYVLKTCACGFCSMLILLSKDWIQSTASGTDYQEVILDMLMANISE